MRVGDSFRVPARVVFRGAAYYSGVYGSWVWGFKLFFLDSGGLVSWFSRTLGFYCGFGAFGLEGFFIRSSDRKTPQFQLNRRRVVV